MGVGLFRCLLRGNITRVVKEKKFRLESRRSEVEEEEETAEQHTRERPSEAGRELWKWDWKTEEEEGETPEVKKPRERW